VDVGECAGACFGYCCISLAQGSVGVPE
jgi:hypothetical protein